MAALVAFGSLNGRPAQADTTPHADRQTGNFAINLSSTLKSRDPGSLPQVASGPGEKIYETTAEIEGKTWYRLRLGLFATRADANARLAQLLDDYPQAWVTRVADYERQRFAENTSHGEAAEQTSPKLASREAPQREEYPEDVQAPAAKPMSNLVRRQDERRPDDQFQTLFLNRPLTIGGKYEMSPERRVNYNLDSEEDRDLTRVNQEFRLELLYEFGPSLTTFLEAQFFQRLDRKDGRQNQSEFETRRGQSWIYYSFLPDAGLALQIGRQILQENRSWWWDAELDAIRLHFSGTAVNAEVGVAEEVFPVSIDDDLAADLEGVTRLFGRWNWQWAIDQHLELFWLSERDRSGAPQENIDIPEELEDTRDAELDWIGARVTGRWKAKRVGKFYYWTDMASVRGTEHLTDFADIGDGFIEVADSRELDVRGWAVDAGVTLRPRFDRELSLTARYAVGSGNDQPDSSRDHSFRQTGINTNKDKFRGVARFRYYGELLRPELSNLRVLTFAVGRRFLSASSLDLLYHNYRQVYADTTLRAPRIDAPLNGADRDVGEEIDLVLGIEEWRRWELKFIGSVFFPGDAYGPTSGEKAYRGDLMLRYIF